jgi:hypothetical protein
MCGQTFMVQIGQAVRDCDPEFPFRGNTIPAKCQSNVNVDTLEAEITPPNDIGLDVEIGISAHIFFWLSDAGNGKTSFPRPGPNLDPKPPSNCRR